MMEKKNRYLSLIEEIEECEKLIKEARPLSKGELSYFENEFMISSSHHSNAIEGNTFTYDETRLLIEKGIVTGAHSLRESEDIAGYKEALDHLYAHSKNQFPISEDFIKKLHSYVLKGEEEGGQYRTIQNYVGDGVRIIYMPPSEKEVPLLMKEYVDELSSDVGKMKERIDEGTVPWIELFHMLARHHIEFERIHPFIDGNGRVGRLLLVHEMIYFGLLPIDVRYENRARYYAAITSFGRKSRFSTRRESKTEAMAKLFAESELMIMKQWLLIFDSKRK